MVAAVVSDAVVIVVIAYCLLSVLVRLEWHWFKVANNV